MEIPERQAKSNSRNQEPNRLGESFGRSWYEARFAQSWSDYSCGQLPKGTKARSSGHSSQESKSQDKEEGGPRRDEVGHTEYHHANGDASGSLFVDWVWKGKHACHLTNVSEFMRASV